MNPVEYEHYVAEHFKKQGYTTTVSPKSNDYGVDVFAEKDGKRVAIQAKLYGKHRRINHEAVLYLQGAKDYFDCQQAVIATDAEFLPDAKAVAKKLGIEILHLQPQESKDAHSRFFDTIWEQQIMPLQGRTLKAEDGRENNILRVDWSGLTRITSNGKEQFIKIEIFKKVIQHLEQNKSITRDEINQEYTGRASSGICLILANVPQFQYKTRPVRIAYVGKL